MTALPRLAALAGWHVATTVGRLLARVAKVPGHGQSVLCTGAWALDDNDGRPWLYADHQGAWQCMDRASIVERLGPVTLAWHNWQDGSPSVHLLRTARELTGDRPRGGAGPLPPGAGEGGGR